MDMVHKFSNKSQSDYRRFNQIYVWTYEAFFFFFEKKDPFQLRETVQISLEYINNIW